MFISWLRNGSGSHDFHCWLFIPLNCSFTHSPDQGEDLLEIVMARRSGSFRTFRNDPQLQQYFLEGVAPTGKTLGVGSYGSVVEVKI